MANDSDVQTCLVCEGATEPLHRAAGDYYFRSGQRADYVVCTDARCRTVHQSPRPDAARIATFYDGYYTHAHLPRLKRLEKTAGGHLQAILLRGDRDAARCAPVHAVRLATGNVVLDVAGIVPGGPRPSILDVGCGNGESLVMLAALGYATQKGVEYDERACEAARSLGFEVRPGTAESIPYDDESFDVVFVRHVIEHVLDPARAIAEALRVLRPGGLLSLLTPNAAARMHERYGAYWRGLECPRHLQLFTPDSLARLVARAGATVLRQGASDRSAHHMEKVSRACAAEHRGDGASSERFFDVAPEVQRGEEIYLIARRPEVRA